MSALDSALQTIDAVAGEGDLAPTGALVDPLEFESAGEPIVLPDGRWIYPPCLHGQPVDELACALLDMDDPARSAFLRLIGPPGAGQEPDRARDRPPPVDRPRPRDRRAPRQPVLRLRRAAAGPVLG